MNSPRNINDIANLHKSTPCGGPTIRYTHVYSGTWELVSPIRRKLEYGKHLASPEGTLFGLQRWEYRLDDIAISIGLNLLFRFFIDLSLTLDLHFDPMMFDYWKLNFWDLFDPTFEKVEKARYGVTTYDNCIYDPEQVHSGQLERVAWQMRYRCLDQDIPVWRQADHSLVEQIAILKDMLIRKGIAEHYVDAIEEQVAIVEGKVCYGAYVTFAIVNISRVMPSGGSSTWFKIRLRREWVTEVELESVAPYECHVVFSRVGYAYPVGEAPQIEPELEEWIVDEIDEHRKWKGMLVWSPEQVLYQRVFFLPRTKRMFEVGGGHHITLQDLINRTKQVLDEHGVFGGWRPAYIAFAQELRLLHYEPHRYWKRYKLMMDVDDVIDKYTRYGCDPDVLNAIRAIVGA